MRASAYLASATLILSAFALPKPAHAWGKMGHVTVCDLAYRNLTPTSRVAVGELLQSRNGGITVPKYKKVAARHYTSFNVGCLEEDGIPRRNPNDHFINFSRSTSQVTGDTCPAAAGDECIFEGIRRDLATLKDVSQPRVKRAFALFAVGHWLGDIHQPLHVSFADDRGGNGIDAKVTGGCGSVHYQPDNLHSVWDNCLLEAGLLERVRQRTDYKKTWSRWTITYRAVDTLLANTSLTEEQQIVAGEPWRWAAESYAITLDPAVRYCVEVGNSCNYSATSLLKPHDKRLEQLNQSYLTQFSARAEDRVRKAGFRLAHLLNQALDPAYQGPVQDGLQQP